MAEAFLQSRLEQDKLKELLKDDQSSKRRQPVALETQFKNRDGLPSYTVSASAGMTVWPIARQRSRETLGSTLAMKRSRYRCVTSTTSWSLD